jgi:hypothetical protein
MKEHPILKKYKNMGEKGISITNLYYNKKYIPKCVKQYLRFFKV